MADRCNLREWPVARQTRTTSTRRAAGRDQAGPPAGAVNEHDASQMLLRMLLHLRDYRANPRELDGTRHRIITSAVELFASRGYQATSMRDIADRVGIKAASIYAHFPGKEALLGETVKWVLDDFIAFVTEPLEPGQSARDVLETMIKRHAIYQMKQPSMLDAWHVLLEVDRLAHFLPDEAREGVAAQRQLYNDLTEALVANVFPGVDRPGDRVRAVRTLCGRVSWWHSGVGREDPEGVAEFVWSLAVSILVGTAAD